MLLEMTRTYFAEALPPERLTPSLTLLSHSAQPLMRVNGKPYKPPNHNSPTILRDDSSTPVKSPAIETLRLFLLSRYSPQAKLLNMENMADDPVLKEAGVAPPGVKGASTTLAGALWKLAAEMFPEVSVCDRLR